MNLPHHLERSRGAAMLPLQRCSPRPLWNRPTQKSRGTICSGTCQRVYPCLRGGQRVLHTSPTRTTGTDAY